MSLLAVILDLRVADRCVQFWVTQGLGSEFHFEIARAAALSGILFSWHYGPYSLKNDFMAKTCFSLMLMLLEELPEPRCNS